MDDLVRSYRTVDKTGWGSGAWQDEPDKLQWVDRLTELDCLVVRNHAGALCGYVGVAEEHPWFGLGYSDCPRDCGEDWCQHTPESVLEVHGGVTFADRCQETDDEATGICHLPIEGRPETVWWFGFDCAHAYDLLPGYAARFRVQARDLFLGDVYRDIAYVRGECARLARQLAAVAR